MSKIKESAPTQTTVLIHNVIEYYGHITVAILKEVIAILKSNYHQEVMKFEFEGKDYGTEESDMEAIVKDWEEWYLRVHGFKPE